MTLSALGAGYVVLGALAGSGIAYSLQRESFGLLVFLAFLGVVCLLGLCWVVLEWWHVRHRPGAVLGHAADGAPALVVARAPWTTALAVVATVAVAAALLAGGGLAAVDGNWVLAVVLLAAGVWIGGHLAPFARGRAPSGGVYLTPSGVEHRVEGAWWRIGWMDMDEVVPAEPLVVVLKGDARVERGPTSRWRWTREVQAPEGTLGIQTRHLAEDGAVLAYLLLTCRDQPESRGQLGTPESLEWEILRSEA